LYSIVAVDDSRDCPREPGLHQSGPRCGALPHLAIAALAGAEAVLVQASWPQLTAPATPTAWRPYVAATIIAATWWLACLGYSHLRRAGGGPVLPLRRTATASQIVGDLLVAAAAVAILSQGHASNFALAGLWLIGPALLAAALPSAVLLIVVTSVGYGPQPVSAAEPSETKAPGNTCRLASTLVLTASLALLASHSNPLLSN
jgi:hypothetical protein